jgi:hypothetical protein
VFRCVECASVDLRQNIVLMARAAGMRIIGVQGEEDAPFPEERDGIRRIALPARRRRPKGPSAFSSTARMN